MSTSPGSENINVIPNVNVPYDEDNSKEIMESMFNEVPGFQAHVGSFSMPPSDDIDEMGDGLNDITSSVTSMDAHDDIPSNIYNEINEVMRRHQIQNCQR